MIDRRQLIAGVVAAAALPTAAVAARRFDIVVRGGTVIDGSGSPGRRVDVGIIGDRIVHVGPIDGPARRIVDARGLVVAPGFINMLSWANESLLADGRGASDLLQGITLEVMGEGWSSGPYNDAMANDPTPGLLAGGDYKRTWRTLGQFLEHLVASGVSPNVASHVGSMTVRINVMGDTDRRATAEELAAMARLVDQAMREGAMGVGSALIYAPDSFAATEDIVALCKVAARHGGIYISHMRSEADRLDEAFGELLAISRAAGIRAQVHHIKAIGRSNWPKFAGLLDRIDEARGRGLDITANMYPYDGGQTGLYGALPPWLQTGANWERKLADAPTRARVAAEIRSATTSWENLYRHTGPANMVLLNFDKRALKPLAGKTLAAIAELRHADPVDVMLDLVLENDSASIFTIYRFISEDNIKAALARPWVCFGTDEPAYTGAVTTGVHPRAYGTFPRVLGHYVRDEGSPLLPEAIRRMTGLPARTLRLRDRGIIASGRYADLAIFDPAKISDPATYAEPHRYAVGMRHVLVNGVPVVVDGEHAGAKPGRVVRGPGWRG